MSGSTQTAEPNVRQRTFSLQAFKRSTREHPTRPPLAGVEVTCIPREGGFTRSFNVASLAAGILFLLSDEAREIRISDRDSDRWAITLVRTTSGENQGFGVTITAANMFVYPSDSEKEEIVDQMLRQLPTQPAASDQQSITFSPTEPSKLHRDPVG